MDSFAEDITLPLDFNASANITRYQDTSAADASRSDPAMLQAAPGKLLNMSNEMSPNTSRTMKDYATQISDLKKENFSLKLRIFYMEERMQEEFTGDHEHIYRTNIELKVECESLRKELQDKQELLVKASNAMACMESSGSNEIERVHQEARKELQQVKEAMDEKVQSTTRELSAVRAEADNLAKTVKDLKDYVHELEEEKKERERESQDSESEKTPQTKDDNPQNDAETPQERINTKQALQDKEKVIDQLRESLQVNKTVIEALNEEKKNSQEQIIGLEKTVENLEKQTKDLENEASRSKQETQQMQNEYMQHISEQQQRLDEFEIAARQMSEELEKREEQIQEMEAAMKEAEEVSKELADNVEEMRKEKEAKNSRELIMRDKAITGLTTVIQKKDEEISNLQTELERRESRLEELTNTVNQLNNQEADREEKRQKLKTLEEELKDLQNLNKQLENENKELREKLKSKEKLIKNLEENAAEKDKELKELMKKYQELQKKQQEEERARLKCIQEQEEISRKFEQEKLEFAELLDKTRREYEEMTREMEKRGGSHNFQNLQEKLHLMENQLRSKQAQLEEATSLFKKAENDRKTALNELEAAMKRRDEDQKHELEAKERVNAAKSAEIERLRNELRMKEDKLQNLEVDLLQLDRTAREAEDMARLSAQEVTRWKEDGGRKDAIITELTNSLEEFYKNSPHFDHKKFIELMRENDELKRLLQERESELFYLQHKPDSEKQHASSVQIGKLHVLDDERSPLDEGESDIHLTLNSLQHELEGHKKELNNAKNLISELTVELENNHKRVVALQETCEAKDQVIEDLQSCRKPFPVVESDEESDTTTTDSRVHERVLRKPQRYIKRKSRNQQNQDNEEVPLSPPSAHAKLRMVRNGDHGDSSAISDEDEIQKFIASSHSKERELKEEIQSLQEQLRKLKGAINDNINSAKELEEERENLRRLSDILREEQKIYKNFINSNQYPHLSESDKKDLSKVRRSLNDQLVQIDELRTKLEQLMLDKAGSLDENELEEILRKPSLTDAQKQRCHKDNETQVEMDLLSDQNKISTQVSDTDATSHFSDESESMGSLSRRELRDVINNLRKKLENAEKLNQLLRNEIESKSQQLEDNKAAANPQLLQQLTSEVEKLKQQLKSKQDELKTAEKLNKEANRNTSVLDKSLQSEGPPLSDKELILQQQLDSSRSLSVELRSQCRNLQTKLSATEETVRQQADKLRRHQAALSAAGIPTSPVRAARSHPDLLFGDLTFNGDSLRHPARVRHSSNDTTNAHTQTSAEDTGYTSLSPQSEERFNSLIQAQAKELSILRKQLKKSRTICRDLHAEFDLALRCATSLINSVSDTADTMLATSVTTELDRCKRLTRKLKEQLSEWTSDGSVTDSDSDGTWKSSFLMSPQSILMKKKNRELEEKQAQVDALEKRLHEMLQEKQDIDTQTSFLKGHSHKILSGLLTPSSSQHSISATEDEISATFLQSAVSQNTEYVPLPDRRSSPWQSNDDSKRFSPRKRKSLPMYQRTIAVTEYLPSNDINSQEASRASAHGRHRLPTSSDAENCTASYGGSWNVFASPRKSDEYKRDKSSPNRSQREEMDLSTQTLNDARSAVRNAENVWSPEVLGEHLNEIRLLRQRLETSIQTTDKLREELERKLHESEVEGSLRNDDERFESEIQGLRKELTRSNEANAKLRHQLEAERKMKNNYAETLTELGQLRHHPVESSSQTEVLGEDLYVQVINEKAQNDILNHQLRQKEAELRRLRDELERCRMKERHQEKSRNKEAFTRMRDELNRVREELDENRDLVHSLKSELALYEKIHKNKDMSVNTSTQSKSSAKSLPFDISELLSEIKMLRIQLERSIEANRALRKQLEEQLNHSTDKQTNSPRTTTINIHHFPSDQSGHENSPRKSSLPGDDVRKTDRRLDFSQKPKSTSVLMTPPPSASSCGDDLGFKFSPLPDHTSTAQIPDDVMKTLNPTAGPADHLEGWTTRNLPHFSLHGPYVLGKLSDYNELKKKVTGSRLLTRSMMSETSISDHVSTQRSPSDLLQNLHVLYSHLEESGKLLKTFWPASIDPLRSHMDTTFPCHKCGRRRSDSSEISKCTKDAGFGSDSSMNSEVEGLRREVGKLNRRLSAQDKLLQTTVSRLQTANRMKEGIEHAILQQLTVTHDVLKKARGNLEAKASETGSNDHASFS